MLRAGIHEAGPVIFVHGLWLHSSSWAPWQERFTEAGYESFAPGWPLDADTVEGCRADPVALVQTAASLPIVLFAVAAGTIGDLVDRRRFLLITQAMMLLAATALGLLAIAGLVSPWVLLALIFAVGTGQALTSPTWQTLQPELGEPAE